MLERKNVYKKVLVSDKIIAEIVEKLLIHGSSQLQNTTLSLKCSL